jgi:hypothetical protein
MPLIFADSSIPLSMIVFLNVQIDRTIEQKVYNELSLKISYYMTNLEIKENKV